MEFVVATRNQGKLREIRAIIPAHNFKSLDDFRGITEPEETGASYWENALIKAKTVFLETGIPTLADDSGLEVDWLCGAPGVRSARYGGFYGNFERKINLLLEELKDVPYKNRKARFVCVACLVYGDKVFFREGILEGYIAESPRGTGGFGFDPVFYLPEFGKTVAELPSEVKNRISHRAKAFRKISELLH